MKEECFVTGGTGFIGTHLLVALTRQGHPVTVLLRQVGKFTQLQDQIDQLGGAGHLLTAVAGDLTQANLGLSDEAQQRVAKAKVIFHLGAQFAWGLSMAQARAVNLEGALRIARLAAEQRSRLVLVGGFMLENREHLQRIGINLANPAQTDWPGVYRRCGGYEASKLEAHFAVLECMRALNAELTIVHPATVCGHSGSGHILPNQELVGLIRNLAAGALGGIPGSPAHWLPLVSVDFLAELLVAAAFDPEQAGKQVLALDEQTPNLQGLVELLAKQLDVVAPKRHVPIGLLRLLLKIPGMPALLRTSPESLDFIQPTRFNTQATHELAAKHQLVWPDIQQAAQATARYVAAMS